MRERTVTIYHCELCSFSSEDRDRVEQHEAQGVEAAPSPDAVGFIRRVETEHARWGSERHEWLVQVKVASTTVEGHHRHCTVEVVPWGDADEDMLHKSVLTITRDAPESFMLDEIEFDRAAAEESLLS